MDRFMSQPETDRQKLDRLNAAIRVMEGNIRVNPTNVGYREALARYRAELATVVEGCIR
jgi:hypothetical protein